MIARLMADTNLFERASMYTSRDSLEQVNIGEIVRLENMTGSYYLERNGLGIGLAE